MAKFKDFQHGPLNMRHGEKVSHIRPANWNHEILDSKYCPKPSSAKAFPNTENHLHFHSDEQSDSLARILSKKTSLLSILGSWLKASCSHFYRE